MLFYKHRKTLAISVILGVSLYLVAIFSTDTGKIKEALQAFHFSDWLLILTVSFSNFVFRFFRWQMYIRHFSYSIPSRLHFAYYLSGLALTTTPAKAGETIRSLYLLPHGVKWSHSLASFFTERFLDIFLVIATSLFFLRVIPGSENKHTLILIPALTVMVLLLLSMQTPRPANALQRLAEKIKNKRFKALFHNLSILLASARILLSKDYLIPSVVLGITAWSMHGIVFYLVAVKVGFDISPGLAIVIYSFSIIAGALSMIPGGIGTTEVALGLLLGFLGAESHVAIIVPILTRLATLWYAVTIGLLANAYLGAKDIHPQANNVK